MTIDEKFKTDHQVRYFSGTTYYIGTPKTVGELRGRLLQIAEDLPGEEHLKIVSIEVHNGEITYVLAEEDSIFIDGD